MTSYPPNVNIYNIYMLIIISGGIDVSNTGIIQIIYHNQNVDNSIVENTFVFHIYSGTICVETVYKWL